MRSSKLTLLGEHASFSGVQRFYQHDAPAIGLPMRFGVYLPPVALGASPASVPALLVLAGLTCNEETFAIKAGAQRVAAQLGLAIVTPDTSPRSSQVPGQAERWDFGLAAGFYLDATQAPWASHWRMESYLLQDLLPLVSDALPVQADGWSVMGHSMGGHGALTLALRHPQRFRSLSALAPICAPTECPWGQRAFTGYLGEDRNAWVEHDASALMRLRGRALLPSQSILIDQGQSDPFLAEQLLPHRFEEACAHAGQALTLRRHAGFDHGYYFIASVVEDHVRHHAQACRPV